MNEEVFINNIWHQNCGDSLKILRKVDKKLGEHYLYECEFIKYPYKILAKKSNILQGQVLNPQIEQIEFIDKLWSQHCGDTLRIIKKTNQKQGNNYLWECEFVKYPYKIICLKDLIIKGIILNPKMPWLDKENLIKYIKENFKEKPTLQELANSLKISKSYLAKRISILELKFLIKYFPQKEENQIKNFVKFIYNGNITKFEGKKEDNYYEIDIYLPELKKGIEYNGSYWHEEGNKRLIGYHQKKQEFFAKKGITILYVWDYEWFEDFPKKQIVSEKIKQKIKDFLIL